MLNLILRTLQTTAVAALASQPLVLLADQAGTMPREGRWHVRSTNQRFAELLRVGYRESPTFRQLVEGIGATDVMVYVEPGVCDCARAVACLALGATSPGVRYLRVTVPLARIDIELLEQIGHELRHALEVAAEPDIRDEAALAAYYGTHADGCAHGQRCFETSAARNAGNAVRSELRRRK